MRKKVCPVCGTIFEAKSSYHKYCSPHCRKKHHRKVYYDKARKEPTFEFGKPILRRFYCNKCHKLVLVTNEKDRRTKFCSPHCEKLYWKHPHKKLQTSLEENEAVSEKQVDTNEKLLAECWSSS